MATKSSNESLNRELSTLRHFVVAVLCIAFTLLFALSMFCQPTAFPMLMTFSLKGVAPYPYPIYFPTRQFIVPLPSPIPNPEFTKTTIHSRIRNIKVSPKQSSPWPHYRLGDMFKSHRLRRLSNGYKKHRKYFNDSIAVEYMDRIDDPLKGSDSDYVTMMQIVKERIERNETLQSLLPDNRTLVIHLRTGDVIDNDILPIREFLSFDNVTAALRKGRWYTRGLPFYADIWDQIQSEDILIDSIMVMTGWHEHVAHYRSIAYINEVIKYLEQMVKRVVIRVNENPDEDFIIMSQSKYFVQSGGGYSEMISGFVKRNGGRVFGYSHVVQ